MDVSPIEIIIDDKAGNTQELIEHLISNGVDISISMPFMICKHETVNCQDIECILCDRNLFDKVGNRYVLKDNVISLSCYILKRANVLALDNKWFADRFGELNYPCYSIKVHSDNEIIYNIINKTLTWTCGKSIGINHSEWKYAKSVIEKIPKQSLIQSISEILGCTSESARIKLNDFIKNADAHIDPNAIGEETYMTIINNNPKIQDKLMVEWSKEHSEELEKLIGQKKNECGQLKNRMDLLNKELDAAKNELSQIERESSEAKSFVNEIESRITEKINLAKTNIAAFLSDYVFHAQIGNILNSHTDNSSPLSGNAKSESIHVDGEKALFITEYNKKDTDHHIGTMAMLKDCLPENFNASGVNKEYSVPVAMWLFAAIRTHIPILLAGPDAQNIADALSVSLFARKSAVFRCEGEPSQEAVRQIKDAESEIITIHHAFSSRWTDYLPEMLSIPNKHFFVIHPFVEDLQIEPKSMFSYMLPMFTDFLMEFRACSDKCLSFNEGIVSRSILEQEADGSVDDYIEQIQRLKLSGDYVNTKIGLLCSAFHQLMEQVGHPVSNTDYEMLFCYLPYAYVTGQIDKIKYNRQRLSDECSKIIDLYCGD